MKARPSLPLVLLALAAACDQDPTGTRIPTRFDYHFDDSAEGWTTGFADYPLGEEEFYELDGGLRALPAPLDATKQGIYLAGNNHSDDLFMFVKREVAGLEPGARYAARFRVTFATDAPAGCVGVGGGPGDVAMKALAAATEPARVVENGYYRMSVDKGSQSDPGAGVALGTIGTPDNDCHDPVFRTRTLESAEAQPVTADADGRLWLLVGTDSPFEATTRIYYTAIEAELEPAE